MTTGHKIRARQRRRLRLDYASVRGAWEGVHRQKGIFTALQVAHPSGAVKAATEGAAAMRAETTRSRSNCNRCNEMALDEDSSILCARTPDLVLERLVQASAAEKHVMDSKTRTINLYRVLCT